MHHGAFEQLTIRTVDEWVLPLLHHIYKIQICITVTRQKPVYWPSNVAFSLCRTDIETTKQQIYQ